MGSKEEGRELANLLFERGAVQFGAFKLKLHEKDPSAPLSPFYLNFRTENNPKPGPLTSDDCEKIANVMWRLTRDRVPNASVIVPIPNAADPLVEALCWILPASEKLKILRLKKIEEGGKRRVVAAEGNAYQGQSVVLWDDLVTKADTKLEAIRAVESEGGEVSALVVLVDRHQGGLRELCDAGYKAYSVFDIYNLLAYYSESGKITSEKYQECIEYLSQYMAR